MSSGTVLRAIAPVVLLGFLVAGCAVSDTTGSESTLECARTGQPDGAADVGMGEGPTDEGYLLRGKAFTGVEVDDMAPVAGLRITVSGEGFSSVLCSDATGEWGDYFPAPAPFQVTVDPASIPDGLRLRAPEVDSASTFEVGAQSLYPVQVSLNFESDGDGNDSDEGASSSGESGVCTTYLQDVLQDPTLASATEIAVSDAGSRVGIPLPGPDCAVEAVYPNDSQAVYLGWDSGTGFEEVSDALMAGGLTAIDETGDDTGRRYVFTLPDGEEGHLLYSGARISPGVPAEHVMLVYTEAVSG